MNNNYLETFKDFLENYPASIFISLSHRSKYWTSVHQCLLRLCVYCGGSKTTDSGYTCVVRVFVLVRRTLFSSYRNVAF